ARSWPLISTRPVLGRSRPPSKFSSVDLPDPDLPSSARRSPRLTSSDTPRSAGTGAGALPYVLLSSTVRIARVGVMTLEGRGLTFSVSLDALGEVTLRAKNRQPRLYFASPWATSASTPRGRSAPSCRT